MKPRHLRPKTPTPQKDKIAEIMLEVVADVQGRGNELHASLASCFRKFEAGDRAREHVVTALRLLFHRWKIIDRALDEQADRFTNLQAARVTAARLLANGITEEQALVQQPKISWRGFVKAQAALLNDSDAAARLDHTSWPPKMAESLIRAYGTEAIALDDALSAPPSVVLRTNTLKTTRADLLAALEKQGVKATTTKYAPQGIVLTTFADVFALPEFKNGHFDLQDEASQLVAELFPSKKALLIDYCAGAGGKTLALAALLGNRGRIIACDTSERRLLELARRARRAGVSNVQGMSLTTDTAALLELENKADAVLVDVPCSGTGVLRRKPDIRLRLSDDDVTRYPEQQAAIARKAMKYCAVGGRLVYATCSVLPEENEHVVSSLANGTGFELVPAATFLDANIASAVCSEGGTYLKCLPHKQGTDGFFAAVLERKA